MDIRVFSDFDGTISTRDTLEFLLDHYAGSTWLEIEKKVEDGRYTEERGLQEEIALIHADWEEARDLVLAEIEIDPAFASFVADCAARSWPLVILSGGLDPLIKALLAKAELGRLPVRANDLDIDPNRRWHVQPALYPRIQKLCNHCKSNWLVEAKKEGARVIYIGDGTTDRCPAGHADLVFAKGALGAWCAEQGLPHVAISGFADLRDWFAGEQGRAWLADDSTSG